MVKALSKTGFYVRRQRSSHVILRREDPFSQVVVPLHKSLDTGTLSAIIDSTGLSIREFLKLL
ncbi:MAG: type II toxin-antitoxin system HicA family toxin [Candidatus Altiarchaeota archaeon]